MAGRAWATLKGLPCERPVPMGGSPRVRGLKTPRPHGRPAKPPQAGRSLARCRLRRQGNDLRATAPTASGRYADSLGALKARAPSRTSAQGSRSRRVLLILERGLHGCDELHVARRDAQVAAPAHSKKRRNRMACRATDVFARLPRPTERLDPLRGRTGGVSPPGRRRARHLQRQPPRLRGSVDFGAAPLAAERGRAAAARAVRGSGPPSCSRKAARGGAATLGAELRA